MLTIGSLARTSVENVALLSRSHTLAFDAIIDILDVDTLLLVIARQPRDDNRHLVLVLTSEYSVGWVFDDVIKELR